MPPGEEADENLFNLVVLSDDDLGDFFAGRLVKATDRVASRRIHHVRFPVRSGLRETGSSGFACPTSAGALSYHPARRRTTPGAQTPVRARSGGLSAGKAARHWFPPAIRERIP